MITVYNIRGTNGSGKSTLARAFINGDPKVPANRPYMFGSPTMVDLHWYPAPTQKDAGRMRAVEGYANPGEQLDVLVVGSYRTACGGLDGVPDFDKSFKAVRQAIALQERFGTAPERAVIAEGVLASTVWGSWGTFSQELEDIGVAQVAFCYLDTPLEVCLERISKRQEAAGKVRDIKTILVADKIRAINATRKRAQDAGRLVYDIPWETAEEALRGIMIDGYVISGQGHAGKVLARDEFKA